MESERYVAWRTDQRARLERIAGVRVDWLLRAAPHLAPGAVLELGCSTGEGLAAWSARGWSAYGLDLSTAALEAARSRYPFLRLAPGTDARAFGVRFDVASAFHVVEHVAHLDAFVDSVRDALQEHGLLYLRVPHWNALVRRVMGRYWPDFIAEHLHFFTARSIQAWLERCGFRALALRTEGQVWPWLAGIRRALKRRRPAAASGAHVLPSGRTMRTLDWCERAAAPVTAIEGRLGLGHELMVIAQRRP
jgi:SAM-dependent methyltransferase